MHLGATSRTGATRRGIEVDEKIRDPPPPASFPALCPKNSKLRHIIKRVDKNVFERNGLHHIPYRDTQPTNEPLPVFDGLKWPDVLDEGEDLPMAETGSDDVIDVWAQRQREERAASQKVKIQYHDIPHNALKKLIAAIKYPIEMRLLPHIIREWHRQSLPVTLIDANKIARLATRHNETEVVLQMTRPEVYGLYYDMEGIREITRGLAKRAAMVEETEEKRFDPDDMLHAVPELLNCAVGTDAPKILTDPAVLGTQLWGFVARFNRDPSFRTQKNVFEICGLADRVVLSVRNYDFHSLFPSDISSVEDKRQHAFALKYQTMDFLPLLYALRQFVDMMSSPYQHCRAVIDNIPDSNREFQQLKHDMAQFLRKRLSTLEIQANDSPSELEHAPATPELKWLRLNSHLGKDIKKGLVRPETMEDWQWAILKQYTSMASEAETSNTSLPSSFYLPITAQAALAKVEETLREWKKVVKDEKIPVRSEFKLQIEYYSS